MLFFGLIVAHPKGMLSDTKLNYEDVFIVEADNADSAMDKLKNQTIRFTKAEDKEFSYSIEPVILEGGVSFFRTFNIYSFGSCCVASRG